MTDHRPQYGELATPEEQRAAAGLQPFVESPPSVAPSIGTDAAPGAERTTARPNRVDRLVTIGLLAYGLVNVIFTGLAYLDLPTVMDENMKLLGIEGEFTNFAQGKLWGTIAAVVLVIGWCLTAVLSVRRLRRGRIAWWVPVVGAVATMLVVGICVAVPMAGDPAFMAHVDKVAAG